MRTTLKAAVGAACALALVPAAASADSIAYVKDGNVWIANPDGSGQYQVTDDANEQVRYYSPSQADDGTIVAARGEEIVRLQQNGKVLSRFDPPPVPNSVGSTSDGVPVDLAVSPDGTRVAYTFYSTGCPVGVSCGARGVVAYSRADRASDPAEFGWSYNVRSPEWVTNDRIITTGGYGRHANFDSPDGGVDDFVNWWGDGEDVSDAEVTRQGDRIAYLRSYGERTHLALYAIKGDARTEVPPAPTTEDGCHSGADATLDDPTWSPDGEQVAFADSAGVEVLETPRAAPCDGPPTRVILPGASAPDWGSASVNPGPRETKPPEHGPACGKRGYCTAPPFHVKPPKLASITAKLRPALAKGLSIPVTTSGEGDVTVELLSGRKVLAKGHAFVDGWWTAKVKVKFSRAARKSLAKKRLVKLTVRATWEPEAGGTPLRSTGKLTLRR
jgi:hypothetical protein